MKVSLILNPSHGIKNKNDVFMMWMEKDFITKTWQENDKIISKIDIKN
jgi:hypothetical protein